MAKLPSLAAQGSVAAGTAQGVGIKGPKVPLDSTVDGSRRKKIADALSQRGLNSPNKLAQYG